MNNVVFLTAIRIPGRESRSAPYRYSIQSWSAWCKRNGCELYVLEDALLPPEQMKVNFSPYYCFDMLAEQGLAPDQVAVIDADTVIHPDCPNFFDLTEGRMTVVREDGNFDWIIRSMENYAHHLDLPVFNIWDYFNTGFLVVSPTHKPVFETLLKFYWDNQEHILQLQRRYGVGTDQPLLNLLVHRDNIPLTYLPYQFNMVSLPLKNVLDDRLSFTRIPGIYHFNGIDGGDQSTLYWMERTYLYLYGTNQPR
jgi:hypothetical protein